MVVDTSALLAILLGEPERGRFVKALSESGVRLISAANVLETAIVVEARRGGVAGREFDLFVHRTKIEIVAVDAEQVSIARQAWRKFGKGRHPAALNFGDCFAYALTKTSNEPLLAMQSPRKSNHSPCVQQLKHSSILYALSLVFSDSSMNCLVYSLFFPEWNRLKDGPSC